MAPSQSFVVQLDFKCKQKMLILGILMKMAMWMEILKQARPVFESWFVPKRTEDMIRTV